MIRCTHCNTEFDDVSTELPMVATCPSCGSTVETDQEMTKTFVTAGQGIGKFKLLVMVGKGSFGTVWKALDTELDRTVALKVPHSERMLTKEGRKRFLREGRSAGKLRHPNIVSVHEVNSDHDSPYLVGDFVEGVSLADFLTGQELNPRQSAELVAELAAALDYAHSMGVVHRDIKTSNIMLDRSEVRSSSEPSTFEKEIGRPMLTDFGLALRLDEDATMTVPGEILGTPAFMSPEQASGSGHAADTRSDIYSLGVILYRLLTHELPFRGNSRMLIDQVLREEPHAPRRLNDSVPSDLETICLKAMAKLPSDRFESAGQFADELRRYLAGKPILSRPLGHVQRIWRWSRRNSRVALLSASIIWLLVLGTIGSLTAAVLIAREQQLTARARKQAEKHSAVAERQRDLAESAARKSQKERATAQRERGLANHQRELALNQTRALRRSLYAANMHLAQQAWDRSESPRVIEILNELRPPADQNDLRGFEWYYLWQLCHRELRSLRHTDQVSSVTFAPDGSLISATGEIYSLTKMFSGSGQVKVWDPSSGEKTRSWRGQRGGISQIAVSVDGTLLATAGSDATARLWNLDSGKLEKVFQTGVISSLAFSPDARIFATGGGDPSSSGDIRLWDTRTRQLIRRLRGHRGWVQCLAFSPDGSTLATGSSDQTVILWSVDRGARIAALEEHNRGVTSVQFSADRRWIATGSFDSEVRLWDAGTFKLQRVLSGHQGPVTTVAFSPDSRTLASGSYDTSVRLWDIPKGTNIDRFNGHSAAVGSVAFSPDGKTLASTGTFDKTVKLWGVDPHLLETFVHNDASSITSLAISSDGKLFVVGGAGDGIAVWDMSLRREVRTLRGHTQTIRSLAFAPGTHLLASGGDDGSIRIWNADSGEPQRVISQGGVVWKLIFSPDSATLASGGGDRDDPESPGTLKLWNHSTGDQLAELTGHKNWIYSLAYSPDGEALAGGTGNPFDPNSAAEITVWQVRGERPIATYRGHQGTVLALSYSPDGKTLASASYDRTIKLWDIAESKERATLEGHRVRINTIAFDRSGQILASGAGESTARGGELKLWDVDEGKPLKNLLAATRFTQTERNGGIGAVALAPNSDIMISGSYDGSLKLWNSKTQRPLATLDSAPQTLHYAELALDGRTLVSWSTKQAIVWDVASGEWRHKLREPGSSVLALSIAPDGNSVATGHGQTVYDFRPGGHVRAELVPIAAAPGEIYRLVPSLKPGEVKKRSSHGHVTIWDLTNGKPLLRLDRHQGPVRALSFSPDGSRLAAADDSGSVKVWNIATQEQETSIAAHEGYIYTVTFSPDGRRLATGGSDKTVRLWNLGGGEEIVALPGHRARISATAFDPSGAVLVSASWDGTVRVWDLVGETEPVVVRGLQTVMDVGFGPDGRSVVTGSANISSLDRSGELRFWDAINGQERFTISPQTGWITSFTFTSDGTTLSTMSSGVYGTSQGGTVRLRRAASKQQGNLKPLSGIGAISSVAFSPDDKTLAIGSEDTTLRFWNADTGLTRFNTTGDYAFSGLDFSPDGKTLATASRGWEVLLWNSRTGKHQASLSGHKKGIVAVAFAPDGSTLASGSEDGVVKLWDTTSRTEKESWQVFSGTVVAIAFGSDGRTLAVAGSDRFPIPEVFSDGKIPSEVRLWDTVAGRSRTSLNHAACQTITFDSKANSLASAGEDGQLKLWDVATGKLRFGFQAHNGSVYSVRFDPSDSRLATSGKDKLVKIWNIDSRELELTLAGHTDDVRSIDFTHDGQVLASGSNDGTVKLWNPRTGEEVPLSN